MKPRIAYRPLHGILLLDKPAGLSSNNALQAARRLLRAEKGGHTGSLDPLATGLLPLCFGEATKIAGLLLGSAKAYDAEIVLGVTTDTDDADGEPLRERAVPDVSEADLQVALAAFIGRIQQQAPIYSALKQGGEPLYAKARRGEVIDAPVREVEVQAIEVLGYSAPRLTLRVTCGSGTYIRSLARDLGEVLGCGAHIASLRRLWVEPFRAPQMITLEGWRQRWKPAPRRRRCCCRSRPAWPILRGSCSMRLSRRVSAWGSACAMPHSRLARWPCSGPTEAPRGWAWWMRMDACRHSDCSMD